MKKIVKEILWAIIPTILSTLFLGIYVIIDGIFIGQKLNEFGLAAINIAWPIAAFIQGLGVATGMSCGIYITFYKTKNQEDKIKKVFTNSLILIIIYSLLILLLLIFKDQLLVLLGANHETLDYASKYISIYIYCGIIQMLGCFLVPILRNYNHYRFAARILIISVLINGILDYLFIFPLDLELVGASLASSISQAFIVIMALYKLIKEKEFNLSKNIEIKEVFKIIYNGIAPFILNYSASVLIIVYNLFSFKYGGNDAVAAYTVLAYIIFIAQNIAVGISDGVQPILTYHYAKEDKQVRKYFLYTLFILMIMLLGTTLLFVFLRSPLRDLFNIKGGSASIYDVAYLYFILSFIFIGIIRIYASLMYSTNQKLKANMIVILEPILTPFVLLLFTNWLDIKGIWAGYLLIQFILSILSILISKIEIKTNINIDKDMIK